MNVRDLAPWSRNNGRDRNLPATTGGSGSAGTMSPFLTLHREMNRLFDDVLKGFDAPSLWGGAAWPQMEIEETDNQYKITAELPGLDEKDVELTVQDGVLVLRGEKRSETEDKARAVSERLYGRFELRIALDRIDEAKVQASFRNGLLTVTVPKSAEMGDEVKRIPINASGTAH